MKHIKYKTFNDLKFENESQKFNGSALFKDSIRAFMAFPNGYGISVIRQYGSYGYEQGQYEIGILNGGQLDSNTHLAPDGVVGYLGQYEITKYMKDIQDLPIAIPHEFKLASERNETHEPQ